MDWSGLDTTGLSYILVDEIEGGWAWTLCNECPAEDRRPAAGE